MKRFLITLVYLGLPLMAGSQNPRMGEGFRTESPYPPVLEMDESTFSYVMDEYSKKYWLALYFYSQYQMPPYNLEEVSSLLKEQPLKMIKIEMNQNEVLRNKFQVQNPNTIIILQGKRILAQFQVQMQKAADVASSIDSYISHRYQVEERTK